MFTEEEMWLFFISHKSIPAMSELGLDPLDDDRNQMVEQLVGEYMEEHS
jgi:hypothetical protein